MDLAGSPPHSPGSRVEPQVADLHLGRPLHAAAPLESAQACEQLGERERLRQVVVGAGVEAGDAVVDRIPRGEHEHGHPDAGVAQRAARLVAVEPGQHHVEDDRVVRMRLRHPERVLAGRRDVGAVALLDEPAPDQSRHLHLVLDDQDAHTGILRLLDEREMRGAAHRRFRSTSSTSGAGSCTWWMSVTRRSESTPPTGASPRSVRAIERAWRGGFVGGDSRRGTRPVRTRVAAAGPSTRPARRRAPFPGPRRHGGRTARRDSQRGATALRHRRRTPSCTPSTSSGSTERWRVTTRLRTGRSLVFLRRSRVRRTISSQPSAGSTA